LQNLQNIFFRILRQRLSLFESFTNKVDARNDIDRIRKNILIQLKLSENKLSSGSKSVPKEYNNYVRYNVLLEKAKSLHAQNQNLKQQERQRLKTIQHNGKERRDIFGMKSRVILIFFRSPTRKSQRVIEADQIKNGPAASQIDAHK
jgi:hypothetical protein